MSTRNLLESHLVFVAPDEGYVGHGLLFIAVASPKCLTLVLVLCQVFFTMNITEFAKFLETYSGRDKVLRLLCYSSKWASVISSSPKSAVKFDRFSNQLSACRALLRLFDDIPMLNCTMKYGIGREEKDGALRSIDLLSNIVDQLYYPIEHVAWAIENNYMFVKNNPWSTSSTVFWVISIYLSLMRNLRCLMVLQYHRKCVEGKDDIGEGEEPQQGQYSAQDGQYPDAGFEAAPGSQYAGEQGSQYGEGQEHQNAEYEGQYAEDQGSQYYGDQFPGEQDYQNAGEEDYPDYPNSQYAEGSQYVGDERYPGEEGSQYPEGQYYGEEGYQYAGQEGLQPEEGVGEHFEKVPPKRDHPHFGEPPEDEPEQVTEGILDVALGEVTGEPNPETSEGAAFLIMKNMLEEVGDEADEHTLQKKYGKQYEGPEKPTDMKICDKYFIKPGEFGVSSDLFPGTGERPPNASVDEFQFPDDTKAKGDSLASFLELIDKCSVEFPEKGEDRESESDMELDAYDSEYIKNTVGIPLTLALAEIVAKKPTDPIHFLGHWLYKWRYNQEAKQAEIDKITDLIAEREALAEAEKEKQRLADEKIALQFIDNIMDDVMDASKKRKGEAENYFEEEGEGQMYHGWYGGDTGDGEGYYGQYPPDYPQQGYDQYPPQQYDENPVQGYEQFPPEEQQYMPQEQQQQY